MKKRRRPENWFQRTQVFGMSLANWGPIIVFVAGVPLGLFLGLRFLVANSAYEPTASETITAEIDDIWFEARGNRYKEWTVHYIRLKQEDEDAELTCSMGPMAMKYWSQLEIGKRYEVLITHTRNRCYVNNIEKIDNPLLLD